MATCGKCGAELMPDATGCATCRTSDADHHRLGWWSSLYAHVPHPHIAARKLSRPNAIVGQSGPKNAIVRFNAFLAVKITDAVGTMWCAYLFAALALVSLPDALKSTAALVAWTAQTFIQLVLLSIIIVGQKVAGESSDKRAIDTYNDAEALLHEAVQLQQHLAAQDTVLQRLIDELCERKSQTVGPSNALTDDESPKSSAG
ncbi:MAG: hypothetical protein ABI365_02555 [Lysobacteraceae bacterium]